MSDKGAGSRRHTRNPKQQPTSRNVGGLFSSHSKTDSVTTITVSQLTHLVKEAVHKELPGQLHVIGELSNLSRPSSGHVYFTLKDSACELRCVMWKSASQSLRFDLEDGQEVIATGSVDVYEPRGQYQFYVRRMEPRGVGALELAFTQLKKRLGQEGLFDPARKRSLPRIPRTISVVTSATGAAVRDIIQTIGRRFPKVRVLIFGVRVQGDGAAEEIADAIRRINRAGDQLGGVDVIIVGRGGGSLEDLWAFNEEIVARAIFASRIPVISAVGHEVDFSISDFVADVRAATPTAAAELVVPEWNALLAELDGHARRLTVSIGRTLETVRSRLSAVQRSAWFRDPAGQVRRRHQQIDEMSHRLRWMLTDCLSRRRSMIQALALRLMQVRPAVQLARRREWVTRQGHFLKWAGRNRMVRTQRRLRECESRLRLFSPARRMEREQMELDHIIQRLRQSVSQGVIRQWNLLDTLETRLQASSHQQVLRRGFTLTRRVGRGSGKKGRFVKKASDVRVDDRLVTETSEGEITSRVVDSKQGELFETDRL